MDKAVATAGSLIY